MVLVANAPVMAATSYDETSLHLLAMKVLLIAYVGERNASPLVCSGLLGGGAYSGNCPLVLTLHIIISW